VGHFGFSVVGAAFLLCLFVPNLLWARFAIPAGHDPSAENRLLGVMERAGQVLTTVALVVFSDTNLRPWSWWSWWLIGAIALMIAYEGGWVRYFTSARTMRDFYRSLLGVPVPLATLPVVASILLGVYGRLIPLILASVILGIGHIGIHVQHYRAARSPGLDGRRVADRTRST
jgi:hypothetical protein